MEILRINVADFSWNATEKNRIFLVGRCVKNWVSLSVVLHDIKWCYWSIVSKTIDVFFSTGVKLLPQPT